VTPSEVLPLLVVAVLLLSASGVEPDRMEVVFDGTHAAESIDDALVVGGGTVTVPANASATGQLYVAGGDVRIDGRLEGDVTLLAGNLTVADDATVTGELQVVGGEPDVAEGASVGRLTTLEVTSQPRSPWRSLSFLALQALLAALAAGALARRAPDLLRTVGHAVTEHTAVSGVVGAIAGATLLVLFVYMAFTLVLLPLSILGLVAELLVVGYGYLAFGYLLGRRLPVERVDVASALGAGGFVLVMELLGRVPLLGALVQFTLVAVGLGAVLLTYFGLQRFEPPTIPG
jgi:hypothetical protein